MRVPRYQHPDADIWRVKVVIACMLVVFTLLGGALWRIQVQHGQTYASNLDRQSVRRVRLPGMRGKIIDRHGHVLADNRPSYGIALYLEELRRPGPWDRTIDVVEELVDDISRTIQLPPQLTRDDIKSHIRRRLPLPLLAWQDVGEAAIARFSERVPQMPGVDIYIEGARVYPEGSMLAHSLGYIGKADIEQDEEEPYHYYLPEMAGKAGIEKHFNYTLSGTAGGRLVRVDASGFKFKDIGIKEAHPGKDVVLAIDARIQRLAEEALGDDAGAAVVVDPNNGDVLAIASSPGFDPNSFVPYISHEMWNALNEDERNPLFHRAAAGAYAPGSIFKPVVAMTALENDLAESYTSFNCPGYFQLGNAKFRCAHGHSHGDLQLREAIQLSCNVYFFRLGLQTGADYIYHMSSALGLGQKTGIDLNYETAGLVPSDAWKRRTQDDAWRPGDTCNLSIGQGALTVTPIQMAMVTAALANGGHLYRPRLVLGVRDREAGTFDVTPVHVANEMNWSREHLAVVRGGMKDVVMTRRGTGRFAAVPGVDVAGKTGTAEYGPRAARKHRGWFIAFAPFDSPRYAVAVVIDNAISGGVTAAPRVGRILSGLLTDEQGES